MADDVNYLREKFFVGKVPLMLIIYAQFIFKVEDEGDIKSTLVVVNKCFV